MGKAGRWRMLAMGAALAVVLCVSAGAEEVDEDALEERCTGEWYWKLHPDGYAIVTGTVYNYNNGNQARYERDEAEPFVMPTELDGYPVQVVDSGAFDECFFMGIHANHRLVLPEGLTTIRTRAFNDPDINSIYIPSTVTSIEPGAFIWCKSLSQFDLAEGNSSYQLVDHMLITADGKEVVSFATEGATHRVVVPSGVETICEYAFSYQRLLEIVFPDSLIKIGKGAFGMCFEINHLRIPASVQQIESGAFSNMSGRVVFEGLPQSVDAYSFSTSVSFRFTFLPDPETVYHFDSQEDLILFFQTGDVSLLRVEGEPELIPGPAPDIEPEAPPPPKVEDEEPEVPEEPETPPTPEPSPAGWWVLAGGAALAAGWWVVRKIRPPKSGGHR